MIELKGVERRFNLGRTTVGALNGIDLSIGQGEMLAVWGPSGSGKSTLLNILGLIDEPDEGVIRFDGQTVNHRDDDALAACRNRGVGFVFQSFHLVPVFSALRNVMLPLLIQGWSAAAARPRAAQWLERVGLSGFAMQRPDRLSGGQRQRVAIARALVTHPKLVVADEPTANLDTANSDLVLDLLCEMSRSEQVTCVFATHDQRLMERARRHIQLRDGRIIDDILRGV